MVWFTPPCRVCVSGCAGFQGESGEGEELTSEEAEDLKSRSAITHSVGFPPVYMNGYQEEAGVGERELTQK